MRADNKELPPDRRGPGQRGYGRRSGACFTRAESVARSLALSCQPVLWAVNR